MDLDQLRTFLEIVRLKSFSRAAETCHRSQPAISAQIRQLEQELDAPLFDRHGSRISLTSAGAIFADFAARILELRQQAQRAIQDLERSPRGELTVAANEATCIYVLPDVFFEYRRRFPHVQLNVERVYGRRVIEAVLDNQVDFGIAQLARADRRLQAARIYTDEIKLIAPAGHPLAGLGAVTAEEVACHPLILPKYGATRGRLDEWLEPAGDRLQVIMELDSSEMIKRFVARGMGVSFMAASHCRAESERGELALASLAPEPMLRHLSLIYRRDRPLSKAALGFIEVVLEKARPEG
ncbi:MAG: LysR substrate-binding domain-containing protein [Bryobacteraceae bacterium]